MKLDDKTPKVNPEHLDHYLVAGCSIGHKSCLLHVNEWDMDQTKKTKFRLNKQFLDFFIDIVTLMSVFLVSPILIKTRWRHDWDWIVIGSMAPSPDRNCRDILALSLDSGRKWRHVIHLYIQSMILTPQVWHSIAYWTLVKNVNSCISSNVELFLHRGKKMQHPYKWPEIIWHPSQTCTFFSGVWTEYD